MSAFLTFLLAMGCIGCADNALLATEAGGDGSDTGNASDGDDTAHATDSADDLPPAAWYTLQGEAAIQDGAGVTAGLALHFVLADAAMDTRSCEIDLATLQVAAVPSENVDVALYAWWTLTLNADDACSAIGLPLELGFGIGELSPEVRARLGTVDMEDSADALYGAWLVADGGDPFPFGYADGATVETAEPPPADDIYALEPLLVVALPQPE